MTNKYFNEEEAIKMFYKTAASFIRIVKKSKNYGMSVYLEYHLEGMRDVFLYAFKDKYVFHKTFKIKKAYTKLVYKILDIGKTNRKE